VVRVSMMSRLVPMFFLGASVASGCGPGPGSVGMAATRDTLPNGALRVRGPENGSWTEDTKWSLTELYRVGAVDGEDPEVFGRVWDVELDGSNRLYVLDRMEKEVRVFDEVGSFAHAFGRGGEGPGEFENPYGIAWDSAGDLWVVDVRLRRYSTFDLDGRHLREYERSVGGYTWPWPGRFGSDGRLYEPSFAQGPDRIFAFSPGAELTAVDSFPFAIPEESGFWDLQRPNGSGAIVPIPFSGQTEWVFDHEAKIWVGESDRYSLAHQGLEGDDSGDLWVLREGKGSRWFFEIFGRDGGFMGAVDVPVVPELFPPPLIREDRMIVVTRDDWDIQSVVVFRIDRPAR